MTPFKLRNVECNAEDIRGTHVWRTVLENGTPAYRVVIYTAHGSSFVDHDYPTASAAASEACKADRAIITANLAEAHKVGGSK